jgi:hypothetical protein
MRLSVERWHTGGMLKVGRLELHWYRKPYRNTRWGLGRKVGDGTFALALPWCTLYL